MPSEREEIRQRRNRLQQQLRGFGLGPLMRGSLVERLRKCGRANCACARDPDARHGGRFLTVQLDGRTEGVHVRPEDEEYVRGAITAYQELWEVINGLTACELADLRRQAHERKRARKKRKAES